MLLRKVSGGVSISFRLYLAEAGYAPDKTVKLTGYGSNSVLLQLIEAGCAPRKTQRRWIISVRLHLTDDG